MKPYIKIISAVLTSIMFATAFTSVNATEGTDKISFYLQGDINQDERINIKDVTALQKHIANISSNEIVSLETADFNCDGDVNVNDVTEIQKYALWSKYKGAPDRNYIYCDRSINYPISTDTKIKSDLILEEVNLGTMYMAEKEDWFFMVRDFIESCPDWLCLLIQPSLHAEGCTTNCHDCIGGCNLKGRVFIPDKNLLS